jgi:hypothetical protein
VKQVDILSICPETGKRIVIEICQSTYDSEPDQAQRDLLKADAVIVVCPNRDALIRLEKSFATRLGSKVDPRITLAMPCHLAEAPSFRHVHECPDLVYDPKWDRIRKRNKGRS